MLRIFKDKRQFTNKGCVKYQFVYFGLESHVRSSPSTAGAKASVMLIDRDELNYIASSDTHEPNNSIADASTINATGRLTGTILPCRDKDEFIFNAPRAGLWKIRPSKTPENLELNFGVYPTPTAAGCAIRQTQKTACWQWKSRKLASTSLGFGVKPALCVQSSRGRCCWNSSSSTPQTGGLN